MPGATGSTSGANVVGLDEFRRQLKALDGNWTSQLTLAHQRIASLGATASRGYAAGMGGVQAKAKSAIGEKHTDKYAAVAVLPSAVDRMAPVAFWGAKRRTGWYAKARYKNSPRQHPAWVGNSWDTAVFGQGPYAINQALAANLDKLLDEYLEMVDRIAAAAFPDR